MSDGNVFVKPNQDKYIQDGLTALLKALSKKMDKLKRGEELSVPIVYIIETIRANANKRRSSADNETMRMRCDSTQAVMDYFITNYVSELQTVYSVRSDSTKHVLYIRKVPKPVEFNQEKFCLKQGYIK